MKRLIALLAAVVCCLSLGAPALAGTQTGQPYFELAHWSLSGVDVSGVQETGGRLVGVIQLPEKDFRGLPTGELRIDCALPASLTAEQQARLRVTYKELTKQDLSAAMTAIGQALGAGKLDAYNLSPESGASYERDGEIFNGYFCNQLADAALSVDAAFTAEYAQAKAVTRRLVEALGGKICENVFHANRRDAAHTIDYLGMGMLSRPDNYLADYMRRYDEFEAKEGRTERNLTMVSGLFKLYGLPVMPQFYYPLGGGDWCGASSQVLAAVRDDGALCHFSVACLPQVISAEPVAQPSADWRKLLRCVAAYMVTDGMSSEDFQLEDCTEFARYGVITDLKPCWVGKTEDTLEPGWYCVVEEHLVKDDSLVAVRSAYGDAETLLSLDK